MPIVELGQAFITRSEWIERATSLRTNAQLPDGRQTFTSWMRTSDSNMGNVVRSPSAPRAAVLSSLYRSIDYLDAYLGNLAEQTVFAECDVCIVSVDPIDAERELIHTFADTFANVSVHLSDKRIGIYEAWNIAAAMSDAPYLTNANADDLRSCRSLEVQIAGLHQNPHVDVVFQDMYLTLDPSLNWEQIVAMGLRTDFLEATLPNLLSGLNVPHCGPMWRRSLHDELGGFDESFESAADWEFWIRCAAAGKTFLKLDEPTVVYFINGDGVSRRKDGPGYTEPALVLERYRHLL
jgi:GT2 family glycosyltransferase